MDGLFDTITDLVNLGFAGVGIAVFLLIFILLMRNKPVDEASARLREKFLTYGVLFAVFCGIASLVAPLLENRPPQGEVRMRLAFSPDFESESLTPPKIRLPDGSIRAPDESFAVPAASVTQVLTVGMDKALSDVRNLRTTSTALAQSVATTQQQRDTLVQSLSQSRERPNLPAKSNGGPAATPIEPSAEQSRDLQRDVVDSLNKGDFDRAATLSAQLRTSIVRTSPKVREMARVPPAAQRPRT